ncbi:MAG: SET domain-containing protein-lysine N-methyltransferase [Sphingobacteriales bacterium]|nr:MAG: SET domain-containing protein-lysine N-methyltransferase [Sphingobacteriales bacterium]
MIHPSTELRFISPEKGIGVVATEYIPKGTIVWIFDPLDKVFSAQDVIAMKPFFRNFVDKYAYRDQDGNHVLCWDHARFVNHSFNSNCVSTAYNFELAVRDIYPGEEITDDYGYLNLAEPFHALREEGSSRTVVKPDDLLHFHEVWDAKLEKAFQVFNLVPQPLADLIDPQHERKVRMIASGLGKMDSILNCYFDPAKRIAA